jgi:hypothetical protein
MCGIIMLVSLYAVDIFVLTSFCQHITVSLYKVTWLSMNRFL